MPRRKGHPSHPRRVDHLQAKTYETDSRLLKETTQGKKPRKELDESEDVKPSTIKLESQYQSCPVTVSCDINLSKIRSAYCITIETFWRHTYAVSLNVGHLQSREPEIKAVFVFISKFCRVTYLDFLHACNNLYATSNKIVWEKVVE